MARDNTVGIFSRESEDTYRWLIDFLSCQCGVNPVRPVYISNSGYPSLRSELSNCSLAILYHSKNRGRVNITDVTDSLYDEELKALSQGLGKNKVMVVIDDLEDSSEEAKDRILHNQPSIRTLAGDVMLFSKEEKRRLNEGHQHHNANTSLAKKTNRIRGFCGKEPVLSRTVLLLTVTVVLIGITYNFQGMKDLHRDASNNVIALIYRDADKLNIETDAAANTAGEREISLDNRVELNTATTDMNTATTDMNTATTDMNTATTDMNTATTDMNTATDIQAEVTNTIENVTVKEITENMNQDINTETNTDTAETETREIPQTNKDTQKGPHTETQTDTKSEPHTQTSAETQTETKSEPRTQTKSEPRTETKSEPRTETKSEPRTETKSEPRTETSPETHPED